MLERKNRDEFIDRLQLAARPMIDVEVLEAMCCPGATIDYQGWAITDGVKFYYDKKTCFVGEREYVMGAYQNRRPGGHIPYYPELFAGYRIFEAKNYSRNDFVMPQTPRGIALQVFDVYLSSIESSGVEVAEAKARNYWQTLMSES